MEIKFFWTKGQPFAHLRSNFPGEMDSRRFYEARCSGCRAKKAKRPGTPVCFTVRTGGDRIVQLSADSNRWMIRRFLHKTACGARRGR
jgi:hypothetical protein